MSVLVTPLVVSLVVLFAASGFAAAQEQPGKFKVTTKRKDDAVEVKTEKDRAVVVVRSPFGISHAVVERLQDDWPKTVTVRLHLKGLENFRAANGKTTLHAAAGVQGGKPTVRVWKDGNENALLDEKSPLWLDIRILGEDGKPARDIPLKNGYFEVTLPRAFLADNPKSITLTWIDFYR
jgi:hypothetical protein